MVITEKQQDLIKALALFPDAASALTTTHRRRPDGHCGVCRSDGIQEGRDVHPCTLFTLSSPASTTR